MTRSVAGDDYNINCGNQNGLFSRHKYPEEPVDRAEARARRCGPLQDGELMPEREDFGGELEPRAD